jgi:cytidine diphosphoramidate kinase
MIGVKDKGTVYWLTGLSGAGKTTLGVLLFKHFKKIEKNVVYLDGDELREVFGGIHGHTLEERNQLAMKYSRLCKMLSSQGIDVICATISMFHNVRKWNRDHIENYIEIFVKVPIEVLIERDQKKLYSRSLKGELDNVMGINAKVENPLNPDIVLDNNGLRNPQEMINNLINQLSKDSDER